MTITSVQNPLVKAAAELKQKKYRLSRNLFLAEGLRTVEEAVGSNLIKSIFYTEISDERTHMVLEQAAAAGTELVCVSEGVFRKMSDTESPQGIIAVCRIPKFDFVSLLAVGAPLIVLDRVSDPGNVGTILRTADATGMGGLVLLEGSADIFAPKTVRASMGSTFHLPLITGMDANQAVSKMHDVGYKVLATSLKDSGDIYTVNFSGRVAVVVGNEANGVSEALLEQADEKIFIPMVGRAESLNVAVASGVIMYEILRCRRHK